MDEPVERLTSAGLAREARADLARIAQLTEIGVLHPDANGTYDRADVQRARIAEAYEASGIDLGHVAQAIREDRMSFAFTDRIYPIPSPLAGVTVSDLEAELGEPGLVTHLYIALGLAAPDPDRELQVADVEVIRALVIAWRPSRGWPEPMLRAARLAGDGIRRAIEGWIALFAETIALPPDEAATLTIPEFTPRVLEPGARIAELVHPMAGWLIDRNMERSLNALNVESMEAALDTRGVKRRPPGPPPAVAFVDLSGFTRLTEEAGDEVAAGHAARLSVMATHAATEHGGRLVKELGDGVLLVFPDVPSAVLGVSELRRAAADEGLPNVHAGISCGPIVERDGEVYGRTVNVAARLSSAAEAGEVLLSEEAAGSLLPEATSPAGARSLKGVTDNVVVYRLAVDSPHRGP